MTEIMTTTTTITGVVGRTPAATAFPVSLPTAREIRPAPHRALDLQIVLVKVLV
jgi:hypothetical protein